MTLRDLHAQRERDVASRCLGWTRTLEYQRMMSEARAAISRWLEFEPAPAVSVGGGKDSTLTLQLVREQAPDVVALRADPPNPLPGRGEHVESLQRAAGGRWIVVPYAWDVEAVLAAEQPYPDHLKIRQLVAAMRAEGVTGVALGVRAAESRARAIHVARRGLMYQRQDGLRVCQPIARWTAEQVIGALLATDRLPLNPVYSRLSSAPASLEHIRDGTWWPVHHSQRTWLAACYPEVLADYDRAARLGFCGFRDF